MAIVLDASAVMAVLHGESGAAMVEENLEGASMSAVTLGEILSKLHERGATITAADAAVRMLGVEVRSFTAGQAFEVARLRPATRRWGLSFADRACLALAAELGCAVLTADRAWAEAELAVVVRLIR